MVSDTRVETQITVTHWATCECHVLNNVYTLVVIVVLFLVLFCQCCYMFAYS